MAELQESEDALTAVTFFRVPVTDTFRGSVVVDGWRVRVHSTTNNDPDGPGPPQGPSVAWHSEAWRRTLLEWEAARNYHKPYVLLAGRTFRNPLIDAILPAVVLVKAVAVLDDALQHFIDENCGGLPRRSARPGLKLRIDVLSEAGRLPMAASLHRVREQRNDVAHRSASRVTWDDVQTSLDDIQAALEFLGVVGPKPLIQYFGERSAIQASGAPGVLGEQTFTIGVKENGEAAYVASWTHIIHSMGA